MPRFCKFTDSTNNAPMFVNPLVVRHIDSHSPETVTIIHFDSEHTVSVNETMENVAKALEGAIWS
jgi:hypothetical protein